MQEQLVRYRQIVSAMVVILLSASFAFTQSTAFTYQGKLIDTGNLANGDYDFQFKLFDTAALGTGVQQGSTLTPSSIPVTNGVFTVTLDFGVCASCFPGASRFLEIAVKPTGGLSFTTLGPRQPVSSTPYALRSLNATAADGLSVACVNCVTSSQIGSVNGSVIIGAIPVASVPAGSTNYIQNTTNQQATSNFSISGDGTAGGTLSSTFVNAATQYNLAGSRMVSNAGSNNTFVGIGAGQVNSGLANTFVGTSAGQANTTGGGNAFFGRSAGQANTTGGSNAFFGFNAGVVNTTGTDNAFFGQNAGAANTTGLHNAFFGDSAGAANNSSFNTFIGDSAGLSNTTGTANAFFGRAAGLANTTGSDNSFFGFDAGLSNTGIQNAFFGRSAGQANTSGGANSFFGYNAGVANTTGINNVFLGWRTGFSNSTGRDNTFVGLEAGLLNSTGIANTFLGINAGSQNTIGNSNTFLGDNAGSFNTTGSGNTMVGDQANLAADNLTNATAIGASAFVGQSNALILGSINGVHGATADTKVGIGTTTPSDRLTVKTATSSYGFIHTDGAISVGSYVGGSTNGGWIGTKSNHPLSFFVNNGGAAMTLETSGFLSLNNVDAGGSLDLCLGPSNHISFCSSSLRYKTDLAPYLGGLSILNRLHPITFTWKTDGKRDVGLGAEQVANVEPLFTFTNAKGEIEGVRYPQLSVVFINAIKEQQAQINHQQEQIARYEKQTAMQQEKLQTQERNFESLKRLVCRNHPKAEACKTRRLK